MDFTKSQQEAIDVNKGNILVAAAAGSGKTSVLSNRVVRLLTEGDESGNLVSVDEIIVATFTKASASEMIHRIGMILTKKIELARKFIKESDDNTQKALLEERINFYELQKLKLPNSKISTIDSLCSILVKENFNTLGISSKIRIANNVELKLLQSEIAGEILEKFYSSKDEEEKQSFLDLIEFTCRKTDRALEEMLLDGYNYIRSFPYPFEYLDKVKNQYENAISSENYDNIWLNDVTKNIKVGLANAIDLTNQALLLLDCPIEYENYITPISADLQKLEKVQSELQKTSPDYVKVLNDLNFKFDTLKAIRAKDEDIKAICTTCKTYRDEVKKIVLNLVKKYSCAVENFSSDVKVLLEHTKTYFDVLKEFYNAIEDKKRELEIMDFANLEHYALQLLTDKDDNGNHIQSKTAKAISNQIKYILVDECQDINQVQNTIFNLLSQDESNIYMVGDVKQSIYRFRKASPELFVQKKSDTTGKTKTINLRENFRSRKEVCDVTNYIFNQIMSSEIGDIDYTNPDEPLVCGRLDYFENEKSIPEFHIIDIKDKEEDKNLIESYHIANIINDMIQKEYKVADNKGKPRPCEYKDFAILLRTKQNTMEIYQQGLEEYNIPTICNYKKEFFKDYDVLTALNLLKIINNPLDDIALLGVLMSPLFGFSADTISQIKLIGKRKNLWSSILTVNTMNNYYNKENSNEDGDCNEYLDDDNDTQDIQLISTQNQDIIYQEFAKKYDDTIKNLAIICDQFTKQLYILRKKSSTLSMKKLIQYIFETTDFLALMSTKVDAQTVDSNIRLLLNYTKEYESFSTNGLAGFMNYITRLKEINENFENSNPPTQETNAVKILSIHESKGLEYPICILANCSKDFNKQDITKSNYLFDTQLGFSMKVVNHEKHTKHTPLPFESIRIKKDKDDVSEELRVLYVALTRAKEKLIMIGSITSSKKETVAVKIQNMLELIAVSDTISPEKVFSYKNYTNWLIISLLRGLNTTNINETNKLLLDTKNLKSKVRFSLINSIFIKPKEQEEISEESQEIENKIDIDEKLVKKIKSQIEYEYEKLELTKTPSKSTVTKLAKSDFAKNMNMQNKIISNNILKSNLMFNNASSEFNEENITSAQKGTILHTFMQYANFDNAIINLDDEINIMVQKKYLSTVEANFLDKNSIKMFFKSAMYKEHISKEENTIKREFKFNFFINANTVNENLGKNDKNKIFIQGIADCLVFDKDGNITIIDYKTDRLQSGEKSNKLRYKNRLKEQYKQQMILYTKALNDIFGENKVKAAYLYSLIIGEEIDVDVNISEMS